MDIATTTKATSRINELFHLTLADGLLVVVGCVEG
jgi:hypothetical protein